MFGARAIHLDPTTPHMPEENAVAERLNRTIMARVRATLTVARLPLQNYWAYCVMDTITKTNATIHRKINDVPRRLWENNQHECSPFPRRSLSLKQYRAFGE